MATAKHLNMPESAQLTVPVLGFDPSFTAWGFAYGRVDVETGELFVSKIDLTTTERRAGKNVRVNSDDMRRAHELHVAVQAAIDAHQPAVVFSEIPSGSQSATSAKGLGIALGVLASIKPEIIQVMPQEVKTHFLGKKTASKREMIDEAYRRYPQARGWKRHAGNLTGAMEHPADAIAAISTGIQTQQFQGMLSLLRGMRGAA